MNARVLRNDDGEPVNSTEPYWHPNLPPAPPGFPKTASFSLSREEASYLRERIVCAKPDSLFAFLMNRLEDWFESQFVWELPRAAHLPAQLADQVRHASHFSHVMHGAALLYNLMLAEKAPRRENLVADYESALHAWTVEIEDSLSELGTWKMDDFWGIVRSVDPIRRRQTEAFVNGWIRTTIDDPGPINLSSSEHARALVENRERQLKRALARVDNQRARELWNGAAGTLRIDYRWRNAQWILNDVLAGIRGDGDA